MRLEFIGKTKGKVTKVAGFTIKMGQKDTRSAAQLRVMATVSNSILDKFSAGMREFLFERAKSSEKVQKQLDGVEVVSDLPNLREPGVKLGALHWDDEQTGCTFTIDRAIDPVLLKDCKISMFKIAPKDGGSVQVFFTLTTGELDRETSGDLMLLNQREILFELTLPDLISQQKTLNDEEEPLGAKGEGTSGKPLTPEEALAASAKHDEKPAANKGQVKRRA